MVFLQPKSLDEALKILNEKEDIKIIAGGTDLILNIRAKRASCEYMLDCKCIPELNILEADSSGLKIGAAITCTDIIKSDFVNSEYNILCQGAHKLGNVTLRNRAIFVGNICNASPGGDVIGPALVLEGVLVAASVRGERRIPLKDFFVGPKRHVLEKDELITQIEFPKPKGEGVFLKKQRIKGHDLAQVGVSAFLHENGKFLLAFTAVGPTPILLENLGSFTKKELAKNKQKIVAEAVNSVSPITDLRATKEYRLAMNAYMTEQTIDILSKREEVSA